ncbi:MAG: hypothetical protein ACD_79C00125G0004 [uncultured bacterium]|nr:MAG: hypothetical protein ACD_79C00125G0004 [uncultured bacterium]
MKGKILIIEKDDTIRTLLKMHLKSSGYNVNESSCFNQGLYSLNDNSYDIIVIEITDISKEDETILKQFKNENFKSRPLLVGVLKSASQNIIEQSISLMTLLDRFIVPPFNFAEFIETIDQMVILRSKIKV